MTATAHHAACAAEGAAPAAAHAAASWVLCADDYALSPAVDRGILRLAHAGRLGAISCLAGDPHWPHAARALAELPRAVRIGLHLNLSEGEPVGALLRRHWPRLPGLGRLMVLAHARWLPLTAIRDELDAQLRAFRDATGRMPDYIDGHQHVHMLPGIRDLVVQAASRRHPALPVRDVAWLSGPGGRLKRRVIRHAGGLALHRALAPRGLVLNQALLGCYDFQATDYRLLMRQWLIRLPERDGWIVCHPADGPEDGRPDPIGDARRREFAYLNSPAFLEDLRAAGRGLPGPDPLQTDAPAADADQSAAKVQRLLTA